MSRLSACSAVVCYIVRDDTSYKASHLEKEMLKSNRSEQCHGFERKLLIRKAVPETTRQLNRVYISECVAQWQVGWSTRQKYAGQ